jgi:gamma-glutamylcyclotransferase (GGCT)/AIG2-like uncharacterized protein YtfP
MLQKSNGKVATMNIFTYGSLLDDDIRSRVLCKHIDGEKDTLSGYRVSEHTVLPYPTIVPFKEGSVYGKVFDVTSEDLQRLDKYETQYYTKINVLLDSGKKSLVYIDSNQ